MSNLVEAAFALMLTLFNILGDNVLVEGRGNDGVEGRRIGDVSSHEVFRISLDVSALSLGGLESLVHHGDVLGEFEVGVLVGPVEEEEDHVEPGEEGGGEVDVLLGGLGGVVAAVDGVGGG